MNLYENLLERMNGNEYNGYFTALCPFHDDHKPSFFVYEDGYYCKTCNKRGSLEFLEKSLGKHFRPSRNDTVSNILPRWQSWGDSLQDIADKAHATLLRYPQFQGYFRRRKVERFISTGSLGYRDGWAVIPCFDIHHRIVEIVVRAVKGKGDTRYVVKASESALKPLYVPNWGIVKGAERIFVVFGIFDAIALELIGLPVVTGISGKSINPESLQCLGKKFTIIPDYHESEDAHKLANQLGWRCNVQELNYPENCKDPAGILENYGNDYLREMIGAT